MFANLYRKVKKLTGDSQFRLAFLVCFPCFLVSATAMIYAQISTYLIAFILIILALLCCYVVVANKQKSQYQISTLSNLIESMIEGDYSLRGRAKMNPAFQDLLNLINSLADTLSQHKLEAKESRLLLERIMEQMDAMVFAVNTENKVIMANVSANSMLFERAFVQDKPLSIKTDLAIQVIDAPAGIVNLDKGELSGDYFLYKESFLSDGKPHQLYLLTNAERLLMEKERKAWQSLLRVLSHELNNSLTPIATISQSIQQKLSIAKNADPEHQQNSILDGINIINERAESLTHFIASYSQLYHLPTPRKQPFPLLQLLNSLTKLFSGCVINQTGTDISIEADKSQLEQVLINVIKNAIEATSDKDKKLEISASVVGKWQQIIIRDFGSGVTNTDNLFVPFYTTKQSGSGIGLALCRQIMFNHNGLIKLHNCEDGTGAEVILSLPLTSAAGAS